MTKKRAKKLLEKYFLQQSERYGRIDFPIRDVVIHNYKRKGMLHSWSFKGLIKIAYDL